MHHEKRYEGEHERSRNDNEQAHEHFDRHKHACRAEATEDITITAPVTLSAYANAGKVRFSCVDTDILKEHHSKPHTSKFKIRQKIRAIIPVNFDVECDVGSGYVDFDMVDE